ncbi:hypothetical protein JKP88DRAFT_186066 [Tribonema minus]|uniref:Cytochrome c oxidase assembly factor 7 n=1 Tax=Tribonema minus TaxID=303371 RepID=A0A836CDR1_9STRA|nr:hypothetical protein JKP88DRAFT_186066 [Tribonema minus]
MRLDLVDEDYEKRMDLAKMDCDEGRGDPVACHGVGEFISAVKQDRAGAAAVYAHNCKTKNYPPSCFLLGRLHLKGVGVEQNDTEAARLFDKACKGGHTQACNHLGLLLLHGSEGPHGVQSDKERALSLMEGACKQGASDSCYHLGSQFLRRDGKGVVKRDVNRAKGLLEMGCAQGHGPSCFNLAVMYKHGDDGIPIDMDKYKQYADRTNELVDLMGRLK